MPFLPLPFLPFFLALSPFLALAAVRLVFLDFLAPLAFFLPFFPCFLALSPFLALAAVSSSLAAVSVETRLMSSAELALSFFGSGFFFFFFLAAGSAAAPTFTE